MAAFTLRVLALLALLMMPLGMTGAAASPASHSSAMAADHCGDGQSSKPVKAAPGDCAMACASALPDNPAQGNDLPFAQASVPARPALAARLHGLILDIATPPPKAS